MAKNLNWTAEVPPCPYCGGALICGGSALIYGGRDYGLMWRCSRYPACDSYVGCHPGTNKPLGRLANKELRRAKVEAHHAFDPIWKNKSRHRDGRLFSKNWMRQQAYRWLSRQLSIPFDDCHIGMFDIELCKRTVDVCLAKQREKIAA